MEIIVSLSVGVLAATGVYLLLRNRTFPVVIGLVLSTYAVNLFLFAAGGLEVDKPPVIQEDAVGYADPVPQALVLTAIVISFGMTALIVVLAIRAYLETDSDEVAMYHPDQEMRDEERQQIRDFRLASEAASDPPNQSWSANQSSQPKPSGGAHL